MNDGQYMSAVTINEADVYKVTLEELLTDIKNGFIHEEAVISKIKELALKNNCLK
ncbi:hypothetical protein [Chryseobacterium sp. Tr-659]|uniref:hypothetical protein n=1 Tax=Chryseobacterium sp. Tr-659 TaxID=2608340 RepID=UPI00141DA243|nr:hypothetical protein [Chryseobacterium sp. Tr-659]